MTNKIYKFKDLYYKKYKSFSVRGGVTIARNSPIYYMPIVHTRYKLLHKF